MRIRSDKIAFNACNNHFEPKYVWMW